MSNYSFINTQIRSGIWEGELTPAGDTAPDLTVTHQGAALEGVTCIKDTSRDTWRVKVPIPSAMINDGLQTFVVSDGHGALLADFSLLAGEALADDLRAEIDLLRSELEILKTAFRNHCAQG
jgi:hypothetical protein